MEALRCLEVGEGLGLPSWCRHEQQSQVGVRVGVVRLDAQGGLEVGDGVGTAPRRIIR